MTKPVPTISKYMTRIPHTIGREQNLAQAEKTMQELKVRHLPVLDGGTLVGIISDRDVNLIKSLSGVDPLQTLVEDAMSEEIYTVPPETPLDLVASTMAERKYGSAIITQNNKVVGIFTAVDGLSALAELLHSRLA